MLDVLRKRDPVPERMVSPRDFRAVAESLSLPRTPVNLLALLLAIEMGRFDRAGFVDELR